MAWDRYNNGVRLNRLMQFQPFPSDNWIVNDNTECCLIYLMFNVILNPYNWYVLFVLHVH
jgi:hypothetical protein